MATIKLMLNEQRQTATGECPIIIRVIHNRRKKIITLPKKVRPALWQIDGTISLPDKVTHEERHHIKALNAYLKAEILKIEEIILTFERENRPFTTEDIIEKYQGKKAKSSHTVFKFTQQIIDNLVSVDKIGNSVAYKSTLSVFKQFRENKDVSFEELDYNMLEKFRTYLQKNGKKVNTISYYLRTLRAVYNKAIREGIVKEDFYPYKKMTIKSERTIKRAIGKDDIIRIRDLDLSADFAGQIARDIFMFSFYTRGMSFKDIVYLKIDNIINGRIYYSRQKTAQKFVIKITPEIQSIMNIYFNGESENPYIFPVITKKGMAQYREYKTALALVDFHLKKIGKILDIKIPLTSYVARHSWATIAKHSGISTAIISESLGHTSEKTTQIYLDSFDNAVLDEANDIVTQL